MSLALALSACASGSNSSSTSDTGMDVATESPDSTSDAEPTLDALPDGTPDSTGDATVTIDGAPDAAGSDVTATNDGAPDFAVGDVTTTHDGDQSPGDVEVDSMGAPETSDGPWPTNPDKDAIQDPGWDSVPGVGTIMPNFTALDQYGNLVELYDLALDGRPIVLDVGTWFCEPCKSLAWYLSTGETGECPYADTILAELGWWNDNYEIIKDLVDNGEIRWVSILYSLGNPVTAQDAAAWHEAFPHDEIVVLADTSLQLQEYLEVSAMPRIDLLDEEMTFLIYHPGGPNKGLQKLVALYGP